MARDGLQLDVSGRVGTLSLDVHLQMPRGTLVLVGPNGAGKSALLLLMLGIRRPQAGRIVVGAATLFDSARAIDVPVEQRRLGYVPQSYALFPNMSVRENVEFAIACRGAQCSGRSRRLQAGAVLEGLGLGPLTTRRVDDLSGGEKQRVALARALATRPRALLLDEPLAALDVASRREVRMFLSSYLKELDLPAVVVTHDAQDASVLGDRVAVLEAGHIAQLGTWQQLSEQPHSAFIRQFTGTGN